MSILILGRQRKVVVSPAAVYKVEQNGDCVYIQSPACEDQEALQRQFERWWQKQSRSYFLGAIDRLYPIIAKYDIEKPELHIRKMKTLWGSCSRERGRVNLNYYLYQAPPPCIEYVVLHELAHFLYPRHDKKFYGFLTLHMPDWKERKRILDHNVVKGLGY
jgi:predicted metal-dependent hydrolase